MSQYGLDGDFFKIFWLLIFVKKVGYLWFMVANVTRGCCMHGKAVGGGGGQEQKKNKRVRIPNEESKNPPKAPVSAVFGCLLRPGSLFGSLSDIVPLLQPGPLLSPPV